jgi:hypothetical protein
MVEAKWEHSESQNKQINKYEEKGISKTLSQEWEPSKHGVLCDCTDHMAMKLTLPHIHSIRG